MTGLAVDIREKSFGRERTVLKDCAFEVPEGEFVCLFGPSGCGKTTLLRLIAGLDTDFAGTMALPAGNDRDALSIGYVFQNARLLPWRTVEDNILLAAGRAAPDLDRLIAALGLAGHRSDFPGTLSGGLARRVALARAFAAEPDLLLLDEPFVSLDRAAADELRVLLLEVWRARPTTALFVTHDIEEAIALADRVLVMAPAPSCVLDDVPLDRPRAERADPAWRAGIRDRIAGHA